MPSRKVHKFFRVMIALWIGLTLLASAQTEELATSNGLVAFWDFNGSLNDVAGGAADNLTARDDRGVETAPRYAAASDLPGAPGSVVALGVQPGDAQYLTAPISNDLRLGPTYTIEAWVYPTEVGGWNRLVLNWGRAPKYAYHVAIHNGVLSLYHGQSGGRYLFTEGGVIREGRWYHIAAVARRNDADPADSKLLVYVNGDLTDAARFNGTIGLFDGEGLGIGDSAGIPSRPCRYKGYLDDLAIWDRALSPTEIRAHYGKRAAILQELELARRKAEIERLAKLSARFAELGLEEIVFAERAPGRDGHYYANFGYSCIDPNYWLHGGDGGKLYKLNLRSGEATALLSDPSGAVRDPRVHYDAKKILFSYRKGGSHCYNLYEINTDGTGLRQITSGPWDDIEPTYLPDGDIIFCSTRCRRWIGCWLAEAAILFRCDPNGKNIRMLSSGSFTENTPAVMPDGRLLYTRWEYVNRDPVSFHHLWTMNPDGTGQMVYFGNVHPGGVFIDAKPIPGSDRVVLINSPGHGGREHTGYVATVAAKYGPSARSAMKIISHTGDFRDPYPLSKDAFLAAKRNQIILMSSKGETEALYTGLGMELHEPCPIIKRPREPVISSRLDSTKTTATLILNDVYLGRNMGGVKRGAIKKLLILEDLPKPANFHGGGSQPIGHGVTSTLKRILGTVPVEPDGSAYFEVPAMRSIYFVVLDENDLSVKQMRSFVTLQPGETAGCVGCHEPRGKTPNPRARHRLLALAGPPSRIESVKDVPEIMDFPRDVQPILDGHCVRCHKHDKREGGVTLVGDRGPVFSLSYYALFLHWQVKDTGGDPRHGSGRQPGNDRPYTTYSSASPLMKKINGSHYEAQLSRLERKTIRLWIDSGAQYAGTYAAYGTGQVGGCWGYNSPVRVMADSWPSTPPAQDAVQRRCGSCHPKEQLPQHVTSLTSTDHGDMLSWTRPLSRFSRHRIYDLSRPENSLILLTPLSREAGGYAESKLGAFQKVKEDKSRPPRPIVHPIVFADTKDPDYQKILSHVKAAKAKLMEIKRFDMPDFKPNVHYVREMKRYGVLQPSFDVSKDPIDVYAADEAYWRSFWYHGAGWNQE